MDVKKETPRKRKYRATLIKTMNIKLLLLTELKALVPKAWSYVCQMTARRQNALILTNFQVMQTFFVASGKEFWTIWPTSFHTVRK